MASIAARQAVRNFRLAVLNLPWTVGTKEVLKHFQQYGSVTYCNVVFDHNTGFSRGFGFVEFADESAHRDAHNANHKIDGEKIRVDLPNDRRGPSRMMGGRRSGDGGRAPHLNINKILGDITQSS